MSWTIAASILVDFITVGWAIHLLHTTKDWRGAFVAALPLLLIATKLLMDLGPGVGAAGNGSLAWLLISVVLFLTVFFFDRIIVERRQARITLQAQERFLANLMHHLPGMAYRCRRDDLRTVEFASAGCVNLTGYESADLVENHRRTLADLTHPDDREIVLRELSEAIVGNRPYRLVYRMVHHDGSYRWVLEKGQAEAPDHLEGFISDITDIKSKEAELVLARTRAEEMNRLKSGFLDNLSHEIRTPLTSIIGFASLLAQEVSAQHRPLMQLIEHSGERLLETLNSLLDLSMLEAGTMRIDAEWVNLVEEIDSLAVRLRPQADRKKLTLTVAHDQSEVWACLDRDYLQRIIHRLISNAIKFTKEGGVHIGITGKEDYVEVRVADTGVGISESFLPFVFEEFRQESTGTSRNFEGTGLGLTVTQRMIELLDGEIRVESTKDEGSVFIVQFPQNLSEAAPPELHTRTRRRRSRTDRAAR